MKKKLFYTVLMCFIYAFIPLKAQNLQISTITPDPNQNFVLPDANIIIEFDQMIDGASLSDTSLIVRGRLSGVLGGEYSGGGTSTITFNPESDFRAGEKISVIITKNLKSESGLSLSRGHTYSFNIESGPSPTTPLTLAQRSIGGGGISGQDIAAIDFDGDGDLDILTASEGVPERIYLYENDGNMGFCGFYTGGNYRNVEVYDIDGDGDYDTFGATGSFDTELNWFENEGSMPFTERNVSAEDPWTLAGGDLDSDGDIDVVAAVILPNRVLWFANDGSGNFSAAKSIPTSFGGGSDSYFYIRDINSDGAMDILAFHRDDKNLVWYQNDGNQNFTEILVANTADRHRLTSADVDGDGDIDIVSVSTDNAAVSPISWFENSGSENFTEYPIETTTTGRLYAVRVTDLDGDRDMDILAGGYWFENDGSENFSERSISDGLKSGSNYFANGLDYADMDGDGDMDIVTLGRYVMGWQENNSLMAITGSTPFNSAGSVEKDVSIHITFDQAIEMSTINSNTIRVFSKNRGIIEGTFGGGGTNTVTFDPMIDFSYGDIIDVSISDNVLSTSGHRLATTYGFSFQIKASSGSNPNFSPHPVTTHANNATGVDVADIDGDGDLDLVSCSWSELFWHENNGSGEYTTIPITTSGTPVNVFVFDQNQDGYMDIWIDNDGSTSSMLYTNDGNQNFTEGSILGSLRLKQLTDVNHDGDTDIVYLSRTDSWFRWSDYRCDLYGGLGYTPNLINRDIQAGDMDNDGDTDFIAASSTGPIYYKNDDYFFYFNSYFDDNNTTNVFLSDLDGDGDLDPVFTESYSAIIWYENRLTGDSLDFGDRLEIAPLDQDPRDVVAVDIDGDGDADIAAVSRNDDKVVWYENRLNEPSADFGPEKLGVTIADGPVKILSADLDADGDMDLITLSENDDELTWFENSGSTLSIGQDFAESPLIFKLDQNYPNPFNPSTVINYELQITNYVKLSIYNLQGQKITSLVSKIQRAGHHQVTWDGKDGSGSLVASGVYMYRLETDNFLQTRKMLLLR